MSASRCTVCGRTLIGRIVVGATGDPYCQRHHGDPACDFCGRIIGPRSTGGGMTYPDGRRCCNRCYPSAVIDPAVAQRAADDVVDYFGRLSVCLPVRVRVRLVTRDQIRTHTGAAVNAEGITTWQIDHGSARVDQIAIVRGVPRDQFASIVAHELGHAWMILHHFPELDPALCEGFCELFAHLWLRDRGGEDAPRLLRLQAGRPDPVYGDGFRRVLGAYERVGLADVANHLGQFRRLP